MGDLKILKKSVKNSELLYYNNLRNKITLEG